MKRVFLISFILIAITSCATNKSSESSLNKVFVTNTNRVDLLPPDAIKRQLDEYQLFQGSFGKNDMNSTLYLQADSSGISILLLNDFGIEMGSIYYDGTVCELESQILPASIKPEYIILDFQNAYAEPEILKAHYKKYGLDFSRNLKTEESGGASSKIEERIVSKKGKIIEVIQTDEEKRTVTIQNKLRNYTYKLTGAGM